MSLSGENEVRPAPFRSARHGTTDGLGRGELEKYSRLRQERSACQYLAKLDPR